jgi:hypothetical protein
MGTCAKEEKIRVESGFFSFPVKSASIYSIPEERVSCFLSSKRAPSFFFLRFAFPSFLL